MNIFQMTVVFTYTNVVFELSNYCLCRTKNTTLEDMLGLLMKYMLSKHLDCFSDISVVPEN